MYSLILVLQKQCAESHFDDCDSSQYNTSLNIKISQRGLQRFGNYNIQTALQDFIIGQTSTDVSFKVSNFLFNLNNIRLTDVYADDNSTVVLFPNDNTSNTGQLYINMKNIQIAFEYGLQQQIYPYVQDSGNGTIQVRNLQLQFKAKVQVAQADDCFNYSHLDIQLIENSLFTYVDDIQIQLTGKYSYLYNGILNALEDTIKDVLNEQILPQLLTQGIEAGFYTMSESWPVVVNSQTSGLNVNIGTGQDYQNITLDETFLTAKCGGQTYQIYGYTMYGCLLPIQKYEQSVVVNSDFQYYIHIINFVSQLNNVKLQGNYNNNCSITSFSKTGTIMQCDEAIYEVKQYPYSKIPNDSKTLLTIKNTISDQIGCMKDGQIVYDTNLCPSHEKEVQEMKDLYENTVLCYYLSLGFDQCGIIYVSSENILVTCDIKQVEEQI